MKMLNCFKQNKIKNKLTIPWTWDKANCYFFLNEKLFETDTILKKKIEYRFISGFAELFIEEK